MSVLSRRGFLAGAAAAALAKPSSAGAAAGMIKAPSETRQRQPVPMIHVTDLFRPHADPDDHWDLACVYALAARGNARLLAVMIDHPPASHPSDPDVQAVAQMNRITGLAVPVLTGSSKRIAPEEADRPEHRDDLGGVRALLGILRATPQPAVISILGSSRDVALAGRLEPKLFAAKCAGIYLHAGSGTPDPALARRLEYNVALDPISYAGIFDLPCPVFWLPCFEVAPGGDGKPWQTRTHGTYYSFVQKEILPHLSVRVQNYFASMFRQGASERGHAGADDALRPDWLRRLEGPPDEALLARQGEKPRPMWCTGGFFHAAGLTVTEAGAIVPAGEAPDPVFALEPVKVRCDEKGVTSWAPEPGAKSRFKFHALDVERYPKAMTAAMRALLAGLS
jgi:hypothetical protein